MSTLDSQSKSGVFAAQVDQVTVIGTGLLGASIGLCLRESGYTGRIVGVGRRQETLDIAKQLGAIDQGSLSIHEAESLDRKGANLVVLATPLGSFVGHFAELATCKPTGETVITDVGSTKTVVCQHAMQHLHAPQRFVGSHPMAGSEAHGPTHARADLFRGGLCIVTPSGTNSDDAAIAIVVDFWQTLGMRIADKSPEEHDRLVAMISHLPHALASLMVDLADERKALSVAATGFRDTTRVASGDPQVWTDIFTTNREAVLEAIDLLGGKLADLRNVIAEGDVEQVFDWLGRAKDARDRWVTEGVTEA